MTTIGERIRQRREILGYSQAEVASRAGISRAAIANLEQGLNKSSRSTVKIAQALQVPVEWLVGDGTSIPKIFTLAPGETVLAVVPQYCAGPGWTNRPIWVYIGNQSGQYRTECIQPDEQTREQFLLFKLAATMHVQMVDTINIRRVK